MIKRSRLHNPSSLIYEQIDKDIKRLVEKRSWRFGTKGILGFDRLIVDTYRFTKGLDSVYDCSNSQAT